MNNMGAVIYYYDCSYQDPEGQSMLRVTTVTRRWIDTAVSSEVLILHFSKLFCSLLLLYFYSSKIYYPMGIND